MIQGTKVVTCEEMRRLEKLCSVEELMDHAARALFAVIQNWFELSGAPKEVVLVVGKGNKGGDALSVGILLLQKHYLVSAALVYPESELTPLCKSRLDQFKKAGGAIHPLHKDKEVFTSLIVDGIVGTGFHGAPDEILTHAIHWTNAQTAPILAIDIPSGLDGTTGRVEKVAIHASITCCLGLPKIGCFIGNGWDHVGALLTCEIGIPPDILSQAQSTALLLKKDPLQLPAILRSRHKYEAGYVLAVSGSPEMPGAAALSTLAALRSGAGVLRLFTEADISTAIFAPEVIRETIDLTRIEEEQKQADALFIGPGLGRTRQTQKMFQKLLARLTKPTVIDGDGLYHLSLMGSFTLPQGSILTPHHGEMTRLLGGPPTLDACQRWALKHSVTVILKGAPTILFHPQRHPLIVTAGDPGMATAGSGDVLTGICAALLAQKMPPDQAAPLAAYLHGRAGELAAEELSSYCMIASDIIQFLPKAFADLA
ncbi:MAG: NAD(P)H-hydrate dehydratase [Rhabdochlamydiaceae bacterium]|nr:NAD(P)H-hydrate dehydratase [Rhabdochlamydiaceae bacterium]